MQLLKGKLAIDKLSSLFFRMAAMGSKFIIFTYLSKYFDGDTYGVYSLQATTITIAIFILGFDFYNFSIRDILTEKKDTVKKVFMSFVLYGFIYALFSAIGYGIFNSIPYFKAYTWLLIFICISEHLNQEIYRLLLAFKKVWLANLLLFIRVAGWTLFVIVETVLLGKNIGIREVLVIWVIFNLGTLLLTLLLFSKLIIQKFPKHFFLKSWLYKGLKISMVFYVATIFLKIIEYSNRYVVEGILDETAAGIFSFYSNFAMVIGIYVNTIVVSYELPDLIATSTTDMFKIKLKRFKKLLIQHSLIASGLVAVGIYPVLLWQGKSEFMTYWPLLLVLTAGAFLLNVSLFYHSYLYILHREKKLLEIVVYSGVFNVITTIVLCNYFGLYGAGGAFLLTAGLMFYLRRKAINPKALDI